MDIYVFDEDDSNTLSDFAGPAGISSRGQISSIFIGIHIPSVCRG